MVWYDDALNFSWPNVLMGVGIAVLVPVLLPAVGYVPALCKYLVYKFCRRLA